MSCSCIEDNKFLFTIQYLKEAIVFRDHSEWVGNSLESDYDLKITNGHSFKEFKVKPKSTILIKHKELPINCDLPCNFDGVYNFEITACQGSQVLARTEAILCSVYEVYYLLLKEEKWEESQEVLKYIKFVEAYARDNNKEKAQKFYEMLLRVIKKLNCNCDVTEYLQV